MDDYRARLLKLAQTVKQAQESNIVQPQVAGAPPAMPEMGGIQDAGAAPADMAAPMGEPMGESGEMEEPQPEEKELDKPTSWIVKYHNGNFWIGKVFPSAYIGEAVSFFSQRKSVPKEQVREYFEQLKSGEAEEMPESLSEAPEIEGEGDMDMGGAAPAAPEQGAASSEEQFANM